MSTEKQYKRQKLIAITGGIGSGKSVVCRILSSLGYPVYDCDSRAKALMEASEDIKATLKREITPSAINPDGTLNRQAIAEVVFNDPAKLAILDKTVHSAVKADILAWRDGRSGKHHKTVNEEKELPDLLFVETAIPFKSGLHRIVDDIWEVTAPEEIRVKRATARDNVPAETIRRRIAAQSNESPTVYSKSSPNKEFSFKTIPNDGSTPLLHSIQQLLATYR